MDRINRNFSIETQESPFNRFFDTWIKYQVYIRTFWSNDLSFYHEGTYGGRGYRDSAQDSKALISLNPELSRKRIRTLASLVRRDGTCTPGWSDASGPWELRARKDSPIWLVPTVSAYIKETGDFPILDEKVPYLKDKWIKGGAEEDLNWKGGSGEDGEGPLFTRIILKGGFTREDVPWRDFKSLKWQKEFFCYHALERIDLRLRLDYQGKNTQIKLCFPLNLNRRQIKSSYEIPFGAIERKSYKPGEHKHSNIQHSSGGSWPALRWICCQDKEKALTIIANTGTPAHQLIDNTLCISLLRSPTRLERPYFPVKPDNIILSL